MSKSQKRLTLVVPGTVVNTEAPKPKREQHTWKPASARDQIPQFPGNNWLQYQAASILGRPATLEEAQELFSRIDPNTRRPYSEAKPITWWQRWLSRI